MRLARGTRCQLLAVLALPLLACGGGSSGASTGGTTTPTTTPAASASNPCSAALAEPPAATAAQARAPGSKAGALGYDVRDPREFLGLHQIARAGLGSAQAAGSPAASAAAAPRSGDIALITDNGALVLGSNSFDLGGVGVRFEPNGQGGYDVVRTRSAAFRERPRPSAVARRRRDQRGGARRSPSASTAPRAVPCSSTPTAT